MGKPVNQKLDKAQFAERLKGVREQLKARGIDGFLVPVTDEYQGEYPPESSRRAAWLTGFTGSAGMAVVLQDNASIYVDGRYTLQAKQQVDQSAYEQRDLDPKETVAWLGDNLSKGSKLGYDPMLHTKQGIETMQKELDRHGITLVPVAQNLVDAVWADRPAEPCTLVKAQAEKYTGESSASKRTRVGKIIEGNGAEAAIIASPDSLAWLFNIRGNDVSNTPLTLGRAILHADGHAELFMDTRKISPEIHAWLGKDVTVRPVAELAQAIADLADSKGVQLDTKRSAIWFSQAIEKNGVKLVEKDDPCLLPKACKNEVEIEGMRQAHIRDGAALTKFMAWVKAEALKRPISELEVEEKLASFRQAQDLYQEPSFDTIAGVDGHGAIVHYRATEDSNLSTQKNSMLLLDSGGQYLDGTTDVTRTMTLGEPTAEQKKRFTQVLKGHIGLGSVVFPKGIKGANLDILARKALWEEGLDYAHGTGHGVGAYLGVHEGPQSISLRGETPLEPGMVISNEPGYYEEGKFGIRIESLVVVKQRVGADGKPSNFYEFETITMAPIDRALVDVSMLTDAELKWLNDYHQKVHDTLAPAMNPQELEFLKEATRPLTREAEKDRAAGEREVKGTHTKAVLTTEGQRATGASK